MNHFTKRQVLTLCVLSVGAGALFSPPLRGLAQPPESKAESSTTQTSATPQPAKSPATDSERTLAAVGTITGQGTAGKIAKFTAPNAIGNSLINEYNGRIGIGTTTATAQFNSVNPAGIGVYGFHSSNTAGNEPGVRGDTTSTTANAIGVLGWVRTASASTDSAGVRGINDGTNYTGYGVYGSHAGSGAGVYGTSSTGFGVYGKAQGGYGVYGVDPNGYGVCGSTTAGYGLVGTASSGGGVYGASGTGKGITGYSESNSGIYGSSYSGNGIYGTSSSNAAIVGASTRNYGVYGLSTNSRAVGGISTNDRGVFGQGYVGIEGVAKDAGSYAGNFQGQVYIAGNLAVTGTMSKGAGSFKIDHPQHPATEYLSHSFVESPDMMNVYNGNVKLDEKGEAVVTLPSYFQALNREFRYQLTCIGAPALVYVAKEIQNNRFSIAGGKAGMKVSWQVTGVRNDAYARQNRIRVEENKTGAERGKYLYPAGFGFGKDKQIGVPKPLIAKR